MYSLSRRALVEFIGTLALIFIGAGSILSDRLAGGGVSLVGIALAHGLTIAVMASATGAISGGHMNPAVTLGLLVGGKICPSRAAAYCISQLLGATVAAAIMMSVGGVDVVVHGTPDLAPKMSMGTGIL